MLYFKGSAENNRNSELEAALNKKFANNNNFELPQRNLELEASFNKKFARETTPPSSITLNTNVGRQAPQRNLELEATLNKKFGK